MSDSYQPIYDAIRSRIGGCDVGQAVEMAIRSAFDNAGHLMACVAQEFSASAHEQQRPAVLFRPALSVDGNQWCALYGDNLQDGVAGFGNTPAEAMTDFDRQWYLKLPSAEPA
ncbi:MULTISPECIES: hypothetical protein [Delftia]|uniref:hypothetical protein n=1 Tax=Delftia TaxID=80865 RepID=UPI0006406860|nr:MULTISPECIES: hypothetical protein [Delftia]WEM01112.1 hypothetical protein PW274_12765 [Delftia tsuruhatensis]